MLEILMKFTKETFDADSSVLGSIYGSIFYQHQQDILSDMDLGDLDAIYVVVLKMSKGYRVDWGDYEDMVYGIKMGEI